MSSFTKKSIKMSLIIFTIGIIVTIIALSMGGKFMNLSRNDATNIQQTYTGVESLNIELDASDVEIKVGNEFKIEANNVSKNSFNSYVQNGKWNVEEKVTSKFFNFYNNNSKIIIYVPDSFKVKELKIGLGAGRLIADKLIATTTNLNVGAGDLKIYNLNTDEIEIKCGVGNVEIGGVVSNKALIKCGIGNIALDLKGDEKDYNYDLSLGIGEVTLNGNDFAGIGNKFIDNTSENKDFKVECGIGKVSINIKK